MTAAVVAPDTGHHEDMAHGAGHVGAGHGRHDAHGDHVGMFRRRFWWSLLLTVPIVVTSSMVMDWLGYSPALSIAGLWAAIIGVVINTALLASVALAPHRTGLLR